MRIAFVTSGLEPGRDGVGDYTSGLAEECARRGHTVTQIALNDPFITAAQSAPGLLRLPATLPWAKRATLARSHLSEFSPNWVSLQFVCYGFHPRGLISRIAPHLRAALAGWPLQVFFHELWLGEECGARWKDRIVGRLQQHGVLRLLHTLNPVLVRTSNHSYVHLLSRRGVTALRLPLFGHLPPPASDIVPEGPGLTFAFFGTLHPVWPPEPLMSYLKSLGVSVTLAHIGHIGAGEALWNRLERDYGQVFTFRRLGGRPAQEIANFLAACDFGVAATPWALLGKSASATAMVECGLPVIVNRDDVRFAGLNDSPADDPLFLRMTPDLPAQLRAARRRPPHQRLPQVTDQFLADLQGERNPLERKR